MTKIVHFVIPAENIKRAKFFYEKLFDWKIEPVPGPMEYYNITTKDEKEKEGIARGIGQRGQPEQKITNFIGFSSIDEYLKKLRI